MFKQYLVPAGILIRSGPVIILSRLDNNWSRTDNIRSGPDRNLRPVQIFRHAVSPETCLKPNGQVRRDNQQVPLLSHSLPK